MTDYGVILYNYIVMVIKKLLTMLIAVSLITGLAACAMPNSGTVSGRAKDEITMDSIEVGEVSDDINRMMPAIDAFAEYLRVNNDRIDLYDISCEDYWNIVCMVVTAWSDAYGEPQADKIGAFHLKYSVAEDFAKTFMYPFWYANAGSPDYRQSYAVSADPGSGVLDLTPLHVDNYTAEITSIEPKDKSFILEIRLIPYLDSQDSYLYKMTLEYWDDEKEHVMAFRIVETEYGGKARPVE